MEEVTVNQALIHEFPRLQEVKATRHSFNEPVSRNLYRTITAARASTTTLLPVAVNFSSGLAFANGPNATYVTRRIRSRRALASRSKRCAKA
jgi:hypothetical protein